MTVKSHDGIAAMAANGIRPVRKTAEARSSVAKTVLGQKKTENRLWQMPN
jgi:hypothetical protein